MVISPGGGEWSRYGSKMMEFILQLPLLRICTPSCEQMQKVELCFVILQPIKHLRITGRVEFIDDPVLKNKALEERPFLKALGFETADDPNFILFRVGNGEAHFWTWEDNLKEADIPRIKF
jgi:uncharacterized pyridoxamine 5'-phosphate oxidase family protein